MGQIINTNIGNGLFTSADVKAWYARNPLPASKVDASFPLSFTTQNKWETVSLAEDMDNVAAVSMDANSPVPVIGNPGYSKASGDFMQAGLGVKMEGKEIEEFERLRDIFLSSGVNADGIDAANYMGNFARRARNAQAVHRSSSCWGLVSSACSLSLNSVNSPFMRSVAPVEYPLDAWQKSAVTTSWADKTALILTDIENAVNTGKANGRNLTKIFINDTWFNYVRNNEQIQKYCSTVIGNLTGTQTKPTVAMVNDMLANTFNGVTVEFVMIDEKVRRLQANGSFALASAFNDGVAVFAQSTVLGRFGWKKLPGTDPSAEVAESFFTLGTIRQVNPNMVEIYTKSESNGIVDTFADNFYLKINAVAW